MSSRLRAIARESVAIAERGGYAGVSLGDQVSRSVAGTRLYGPDEVIAVPPAVVGEAVIEVSNESTLAATRRLGGDLACLVFASARNPGGGFLNGAKAQEESVARSSALYPTLLAAGDFYAYHRARPELTYSDRVIYSPAVPVFRDDRGELLPAAYPVSFLTAAAPNRAAIARSQPERLPEVWAILARRARRVLQVAAANGHRRLEHNLTTRRPAAGHVTHSVAGPEREDAKAARDVLRQAGCDEGEAGVVSGQVDLV